MKLIFVYNADSGILNALKDAFHKTFFPKSYPCSLCALTYGATSELKQWQQFRKNTPVPMIFLHKDEYESRFKTKFDYPIVLQQKDELESIITADEMNGYKNLNELINRLKELL